MIVIAAGCKPRSRGFAVGFDFVFHPAHPIIL